MDDLVLQLRHVAIWSNPQIFCDAADQIEQLERENEANERNLCILTDELAAARRENAELRKDAERYKWLIYYLASEDTQHDDAIVEASERGPEAITAVIDEAMKS
jgi:hypothetical protein